MLKRFAHYIKLYLFCLKINLKELRAYDIDFVVGVFSAVVNYATQLFALSCIYSLVYDINGWKLDEILLIYGLNLTSYSLWACFFINTITLPFYIKRGEFDRFLLRPASPIAQIMLDGFDEDAWGELVLGVAVLAYAWISLSIPMFYVFSAVIIVIAGCFIYAGISILLSGISFLTVEPSKIANVTAEIKTLAQYPISIYPKWVQVLFTVALPVVFISFYPAEAFLGRLPLSICILSLIVSLLFFLITTTIWNIMEKNYESTGN